jgi:cytochrome c oxidase subunit 2
MMSTPFPHIGPLLHIGRGTLALVSAISLMACGGSSDAPQLTDAADEGRSIAGKNGCGACHGANGQGGVGPAFAGKFGSTVELEDGSTVIADRDYLIESIKDPSAKLVDGFRLPMPTNNLTDEQVSKIVTYIEALATPAEGGTP